MKKTYKTGDTELTVLSDVSFEVNSGEVIALMGPSGVGKTTLLNIIGALDRPDSGVLNLNGEYVASLGPDELARLRNRDLGFVFQFHHLLPEFNAIENVLIPGLIQKKATQEKKRVCK